MTCEIPKCKKEYQYIYYNRKVCAYHFEQHHKGRIDLKKVFKIKEVKGF